LASAIDGLIDASVSLSETPEEAVLTLEKLFTFGDDFPFIPLIVAERIERARNQDLLTRYMQIGALSYAYEQAANIDFFTIREIDEFAAKLNAQYNKVFPTIINASAGLRLQELRNLTSEFLDIQRLNAKKIVEIDVQPTTAQALIYQNYGSLDLYERFINLNGIKDPGFVSGTVEIFR
jgi:hypothetical protein